MILNKENTFTENNRFLVYSDQLNATRKQILDETEEMISRSAIQTFEDEGETITANDASYLASLTVDGKAVQDGTPTPDSPVPVEVVQSRNLFFPPIPGYISGGPATYNQLSGLTGNNGTLFVGRIQPNENYTVTAKLFSDMNRFRIGLFDSDPRTGSQFSSGHFSQIVNKSDPTTDETYTFSSGIFKWVVLGLTTSTIPFNPNAKAQVENGSTATDYIEPNAIGLVIGNQEIPIDLQGNILASLPDGTKDVLTVDSAGHVVIDKCVGYTTQATTDGIVATVGVDAISSTGDLSDNADVYYKLATASIIDAGYITMPAIPDGAEISITAQVTPTIAAKWWRGNQSDMAAALSAVSSDLGNIQSQIDALDARVTALESANSKNLLIEKLEDSKETTEDEISEEPEELEEPEEAEELEEQEQMPLDDEE